MANPATQANTVHCVFIREAIDPAVCSASQGTHCKGCTVAIRRCLNCGETRGIADAIRGWCLDCVNQAITKKEPAPVVANGSKRPTFTHPVVGDGKRASRQVLPEHIQHWQNVCGSEADARRVHDLAMQGKLEVGDRIRTKGAIGMLLTNGVTSVQEAHVLLNRLQALKVLQRVNDHEVVIPLPRGAPDSESDPPEEEVIVLPPTNAAPTLADTKPPTAAPVVSNQMPNLARGWEESALFDRTEEIVRILLAAGKRIAGNKVEIVDPLVVLEKEVEPYRTAEWRRLLAWLEHCGRVQRRHQPHRLIFLNIAEEPVQVVPEPANAAPATVPEPPPPLVEVQAPPFMPEDADLPLPPAAVLELGAEENTRLRRAEEEITGLNVSLLLTHQRVMELTARVAQLESTPATPATSSELVGKTGGFVEVDGQLFGNISYLAQHFAVDWKKMRDFLESEQVPYRDGRTAANRPAKFYRVYDVHVARQLKALREALAERPVPNVDLRLLPVYKEQGQTWINEVLVGWESGQSGVALVALCLHRKVRRITKTDHLGQAVTYYNRDDIDRIVGGKR